MCFAIQTTAWPMVGHAQWAAPDWQERSEPDELREALTGGLPNGRWKKDLMFEGIEPMP
jgi:hypothetical protein